ncbi:MAG: alpha/beta hydrolase [Halofilum sp. (in: g-proteobacteria)]|nr:alpha/beta hydrolase [Halofilum sp. (in: g-proteobacteria)]
MQRAARWPILVLGALALAACSPIDLLNATSPVSRTRAATDIPYASGERRQLDVYRPASTTDGPSPVIVFFYGGRWSGGQRGDYAFVGATLAEHGMAVVIPDYRVYPEVRFPAFVEDGARAVRWTRDNIARYGGDPDRIHVMGHSAGAHIAAMLALDRHYLDGRVDLAGMIGLAGPYDFLPLEAEDLRDMFGPPERFPASQPIEHARGDAPPMLLLHGLDDDTVWPKNSRNLAAAIRARGGRAETRFYQDISHAEIVGALSDVGDFLAPVRADVLAFIEQPVRGPQAAAVQSPWMLHAGSLATSPVTPGCKAGAPTTTWTGRDAPIERNRYSIGTCRVIGCCAMSSGNGGNGLARASISRAASSRMAWPEPPVTRVSVRRPSGWIVNATRTTPSIRRTRARRGYSLLRASSIWTRAR